MNNKTMKVLAVVALVGGAFLSQGCGVIGGCGVADDAHAEATLYVTDTANGSALFGLAFTEGSQTLDAGCQDPDARGYTCGSYLFFLARAPHDITISANGYESTTVHMDLTTETSVHLAVELHKAK